MTCWLLGAKPLLEYNANVLLIGAVGTHLSDVLFQIQQLACKKNRLQKSFTA